MRESDRLPSSAGIVPAKLFPSRFMPVTRPFVTVTPCQVERSLSVSQFALILQFGPSVALYNDTSTSRSADRGGRGYIVPKARVKATKSAKSTS